MSEPIITVAGLRGVIGEALNPDVAMRYAAAFSATCPEGDFVITRDSRPTGKLLADAIHAALNAVGRSTLDGEVAATPTTGILIREHNAAGGIQISASHNPSEYNGMKLLSAEGRCITNEHGLRVLELYKTSKPQWGTHENVGTQWYFSDRIKNHIEAILNTINVTAIAKQRFKVLLDANHGAGAVLGVPLLLRLNCKITILGEDQDGEFAHPPEPTAENLTSVCKKVANGDYDIAFCQDPDADRLAVIDGNGRYIGEEYTVALCMNHIYHQIRAATGMSRKLGPMVINCATSRMCEDIAKKYDVPIFRSAVGEANVVDMMLEKEATFGGEGNGGPIDPAVGYIRDSFVGMAQILDAMVMTGKTIAELADALPKYAMVKRKLETADGGRQTTELLDKVAHSFKHLPCDRMDGLRIDHGDAWVLLRGSNTEPIIRIFAEAPTAERAEKLCDEIERLV